MFCGRQDGRTAGRQEELYDLQEDPQERQNVVASPDYRLILDEMRTRLIEHLALSEKPLMNYL